MKRVTGIGGIFFQAKDAPALQAWYQRHLGIDVQPWGGAVFRWADGAEGAEGADGADGAGGAGGAVRQRQAAVAGSTIWSIAPAEGMPFAPGQAPFMVNYRVEDARALAQVLRDEGCQVLDRIDASEHGVFAWVIDPEGNKVELWQPPVGSQPALRHPAGPSRRHTGGATLFTAAGQRRLQEAHARSHPRLGGSWHRLVHRGVHAAR